MADEEEQGELELTNDQLKQIAGYADRILQQDAPADGHKLAYALLTVSLCMMRLQAGDPPPFGEELDRWYDQEIGHDVRMLWMKVKPAAENLRRIGVIQ